MIHKVGAPWCTPAISWQPHTPTAVAKWGTSKWTSDDWWLSHQSYRWFPICKQYVLIIYHCPWIFFRWRSPVWSQSLASNLTKTHFLRVRPLFVNSCSHRQKNSRKEQTRIFDEFIAGLIIFCQVSQDVLLQQPQRCGPRLPRWRLDVLDPALAEKNPWGAR